MYSYRETSEAVMDAARKLLVSPKFNLQEGFTMAYKSLLHSIVEGNEPMIDNMCEHRLSDPLVNYLEQLADKR